MTGRRIPDDLRSLIEAALRRPGAVRNRIAKDHGVSAGTVSNIAAAMRARGERVELDRTAVKTATAAATADARARMAALKLKFLTVAERALAELDETTELIELSKQGQWKRLQLDRPTIDGRRQLVTTAAIAADKAMRLDQHAAGEPDTSPIETLAATVRAVWSQIRPMPAQAGESSPDEPGGNA